MSSTTIGNWQLPYISSVFMAIAILQFMTVLRFVVMRILWTTCSSQVIEKVKIITHKFVKTSTFPICNTNTHDIQYYSQNDDLCYKTTKYGDIHIDRGCLSHLDNRKQQLIEHNPITVTVTATNKAHTQINNLHVISEPW